MVMSPAGLGPENDFAGETISNYKRQTHRILHEDYDRNGSVKKSLVVILKGLGVQTN
jgi:hypothetical protein